MLKMTFNVKGAVSDVKWRQRSMDCAATRLESRMDSRSGAVDSLSRHLASN